MNEGTETIKHQVSVTTGRGMQDAQHPYISPWPAMEVAVDNATDVDYEQYPPPKELYLLLGNDQTPPEIQNIVLSSINKPDKAAPRSEEAKNPEDDFANSEIVEIPQSSESSPVMTVISPPDQNHSRSTSTNSLSLHTSRTTNGSDSVSRLRFKKLTISTLLSSTTNLIGSVKQAMKSPLAAEKYDVSEMSQKVLMSW
jgi:hypothetical protein